MVYGGRFVPLEWHPRVSPGSIFQMLDTKKRLRNSLAMQALPENVQEMIESVYLMLAKGKEEKNADDEFATKATGEVLVS
jgi:hypothetical protein